MAVVTQCVTLLFLLFLPLVRSDVYTDGKIVVEWRSPGQDRTNRRGVSCFLYDIKEKPWSGTLPGVKATELHITNSTHMSVLEAECFRKQKEIFMRQHIGMKTIRNFALGIYPGTFWCGKGNMATDVNSLGKYNNTDACCRDHDTKCDISIASGETKYGVRNTEIYTISDCSCDEQFRVCLRRANNFLSNRIGRWFFNIIEVKCLYIPPAANGPGKMEGVILEPQSYQKGSGHHAATITCPAQWIDLEP